MAKFRKWTVKNTDQKKQYKTAMGTTDYDIPMFGYKSVLLIIAAMVSVNVCDSSNLRFDSYRFLDGLLSL